MSHVSVVDLEVHYRIGVPDEERANPQRLLITIDMDTDFTAAAETDSITDTIDYFEVAQDLLKFGEGRSWKLLERLTTEIAEYILEKYGPRLLTVSIKKFPIRQARYVCASVTRTRNGSQELG